MEAILPLENNETTSIVVGVGIALVLVLLVSLTLLGWCMRLANRLCGGTEVGFLRSLLAVVASALLGSGAGTLAVFLQPEASQLMSLLYVVFGSVLAIALVMAQNPLRAFGTYLVYWFVGTVSHVALIGAVVLLIAVAVPRAKTKRVTEQIPTLASALGMKSPENFGDWSATTKPSQIAQEKNTAKPILGDGVNVNPFIQ